jgi:deazaflavin-dependent oxidoreductase (nitroreductase family)
MTKDKKPIRILNKYITNRVLRVFARATRGPFAIMRHVGRKSGKTYEITIMVWPVEGAFVIELTYGKNVDWYRNVEAAGGATIFYHKKEYSVGKPEPIDAKVAVLALPAIIREFLHLAGLHEYVQLKLIVPEPAHS